MDKLIFTNNGGHPFTMDDIDYLQKSLTQGVSGALSFLFDSDPILLNGLVATVGATHTTYSEGYILVNKEVYFVPSAIFPNGSSLGIDIATSFYPLGDDLYENGATVQTFEKRMGELKIYVTSPTIIDLADFITVKDKLALLGANIDLSTPWVTVGSGGSAPAYNTNWSGTVRFRKNKLGYLEIDGIANASILSPPAKIFTLPAFFYPAALKYFVCAGQSLTFGVPHHIVSIGLTGDVNVDFVVTSATPVVAMNTVTSLL